MVNQVNFGSISTSGVQGYQTNPFALLNSDSIFDDFMNSLMTNSSTSGLEQASFYGTTRELHSLSDVYNPAVGLRLAQNAQKIGLTQNTTGWCAKGVNDSLQDSNLANAETRVSAAYMQANVLAAHPNFKEISVERSELESLPAGCIIVWNRTGSYTNSGQYGHVAVTLGDGRESSDNVSQLKKLDSEFRVFVPVATNGLNA